ncbi:MAG TPA: hypothetical protein VFS30_11280 [Dehalococcoidia bacterium]|nr:hypothetical protein [Dehalococcoidia bacterium]
MAKPVWVRGDLEQQGTLESRPYCTECSANNVCGAQLAHNACRPDNHLLGLGHPLDESTWPRLREIGGWELSDIIALPVRLPALPAHLPVVEPRGIGVGSDRPILAVTLKDAFDASGSAIKARTLRARLHLRSDAKLVLLCTGPDRLLARALDHSLPNLLDAIATGGFDAVSGLATSIYRDYPAMENLLSLKEGLLTCRQMQERGIPAFPMFGFSTALDITRVAKWLHDNPCVRTIGLDFQDAKAPLEWAFQVNAFRSLVTAGPKDIHYLVKGPSAERRIRSLFKLTKQLTIATQQADMLATLRGKLFPNKAKRWIFTRECKRLDRTCADAKSVSIED